MILRIRCEHGHEQSITYDSRYTLDEVNAHAVLMCGGFFEPANRVVPGYVCMYDDSPGEELNPCGGVLHFEIHAEGQ